MRQILLIGSGGQVGQELQKTLPAIGKVIGTTHADLDLTQPEPLRQIIRSTQPDLIINAAAYTAVDQAEAEPTVANQINGEAPTIMAEEAQKLGAALIHISTDYVFDGTKNTPYTETDTPNPIGAYGKSKLLGEQGIQAVQANFPEFRYAILRTAWVYGALGKANFVKTMLRLGSDREELRVVSDQVGTPTWAGEIAQAITPLSTHLLAPASAELPGSGIYHFTNSGITSWYDFAVAIFEEAAQLKVPLKIQRVIPISSAEYPTPAKRPAYSALAWQKIAQILQAPPPHWRHGLRQMLTELYSQTYESDYSLRR
ncbi:MAG TPA: dTDP-4-dehydrorhamnose reductase [Allocoleopsis sp.]